MTDDRQSRLITAMRFPLIVLVVIAHSAGSFDDPFIALSLDGWNVYHFSAELLCRQLCSIGTCWFFVISGYFFFLNVNDPSIRWIPAKWKKRIRTLLIPYLIWNLFYVLLVYVKTSLFSMKGLSAAAEETAILQGGPLYWLVTGPADFPLWFMLALMIMSLLTPIIYPVFRRFPTVSLVALIIFYLCFPGEPPLVTMRGLFFFCIGAWAGIQKKNMLDFCQRFKVLSMIGAIVLSVVATLRNGYPDYFFWRCSFYLFGMVAFMNLCYALTKDNPHREARFTKLSASVFFIYAAHEIYILGWTKGVFVRVFGEGLVGSWIKLLFVPVVVLLVCLGLYYLLNRIMPRTLAFCCGGRSKPQTVSNR